MSGISKTHAKHIVPVIASIVSTCVEFEWKNNIKRKIFDIEMLPSYFRDSSSSKNVLDRLPHPTSSTITTKCLISPSSSMMSKQQSDEEFQKSSETNVYQEEVNISWIYPRTKEKRRWRSDFFIIYLLHDDTSNEDGTAWGSANLRGGNFKRQRLNGEKDCDLDLAMNTYKI
ncbi:8683_t:CDS:1 [Paraglomus brasilianum]|uniref:8683_t:CDS:1 n=1 Tax=Paraglomus brasilianum TaxID=144538 RepID=A0A9N9B8S7_9GLOM|nr:8683_t:CDS:1 [Paraglomus brasilianum]